MANFYTAQALLQLNEVDAKRGSGELVHGRLRLATTQYTTDGTEDNGDLIYIAKFENPIQVDPTQSSVAVSATLDGSAVTMDIGDDPDWTHITPDPDRYADGITVTSAGIITYGNAGAAVHTPYTTTKDGWLVATIISSGTLNASVKLTFRTVYTIN